MSRDDQQADPILDALATLGAHDIDPLRAERTRARAHAQLDHARLSLERRRKLREAERAVVAGISPWVRWGEPAAVGVVALVYLGWAFATVGRFLG